MKSYKLCLIILVITSIFFSCQLDENEPTSILEEGILLEIAEGENSYIDETGKHFYTNSFSSSLDSNLYRLKLTAGVKYHLFCVNPDTDRYYISMILLNSNRDTISLSMNFNNKAELFFTPSISEDIYLLVKTTTGPFVYNLYMEECEPANLAFMGYDWEYSGVWKSTGIQSLEFEGSNTGEFRWIRLSSSISDHLDLSFTIKSENTFPSFGIIFHGESELLQILDYKEELPQKGAFFNIQTPEKYMIWNIDRTGMGYEYGTFSIPGINITEGINIKIGHAATNIETISVNNTILKSFSNSSLKGIYLVVEDKGFVKVSFENFTIYEDTVNPDYEGTWVRPVTKDEPMGIYEGRELINFYGDQLDDKLQVYDKTINQWVIYKSAKGTLSMHNNFMNVHINEACVSEYDFSKSQFTGVLKCVGEESYGFTTNLPQFWMRKDFIFGYNVSNNSLTISYDKNNNGDYTEQGEKFEYTRFTRE